MAAMSAPDISDSTLLNHCSALDTTEQKKPKFLHQIQSLPQLEPTAPFQLPTVPELSSHNAAILVELRAFIDSDQLIPDLFEVGSPSYQRAVDYCTTPCLRRHLTSLKWNLAHAKQCIRETLVWREEYRPDLITAKDVESEAANGNTYINGMDKEGRPIIYVRKRGALGDPEKNVRLVVYTMECAIRLMPQGVEKMSMIFDFTHYAKANSPPIHITRMMLKFIISHYPERMGVAFFVNTPWVFGMLWNVISHFLDPATKSKIYFIKLDQERLNAGENTHNNQDISNGLSNTSTVSLPTPASSWSLFSFGMTNQKRHADSEPELAPSLGVQLSNMISEKVLEKDFGGSYDYKYDYSKYTDELKKHNIL
ncbi:hypothetical protein BDV3_001892 [Batrachochytrium dendrobatidis]